MSAYGKIITGVALTPAEAGTIHPQGSSEDLQLALIYGIQDQGKCIRLPQPQMVYMPSPDGLADGCGWDPSEFVVWKNLAKDWNTVHVQTQSKSLFMALKPADDVPSPLLQDVLKNDWLKLTNPPNIGSDDQLGFLWEHYGTGGEYDSNCQMVLAAILLKAYGVQIPWGSLPGNLPFSKLQSLVGTD
jgi:hypothetical protein